MEHSSVLEKACIVHITSSTWPARKKIPGAILARIGNPELLSGMKKLSKSDLITKPKNIVSAAEKAIDAISTPFPIKSMNVIHFNRVEQSEEILTSSHSEFLAAVREIVSIYDEIQIEARRLLEPDGLWDPEDYPYDLNTKYSFTWNYFTISSPEDGTFSKTVLDQAHRKLLRTFREAEAMTDRMLLHELKDLTTHMVERLTPGDDGQPKIFRDTMVQNFRAFIETFPDRNLYNSREVSGVVSEIQGILHGIAPNTLRSSDVISRAVKEDMQGIKARLDQALTKVTRSIMLPQSKAA